MNEKLAGKKCEQTVHVLNGFIDNADCLLLISRLNTVRSMSN